METNCAPAGVGAYRCIAAIPYLVGDAIALPNVEFRRFAGLLTTANTSIFHSSLPFVFVLIAFRTALSLSPLYQLFARSTALTLHLAPTFVINLASNLSQLP